MTLCEDIMREIVSHLNLNDIRQCLISSQMLCDMAKKSDHYMKSKSYGKIIRSGYFANVVRKGNLYVCKYIWRLSLCHKTHECFIIITMVTINHACESGHLEILQWLFELIDGRGLNIHHQNELLFRSACERGHLHILQWLTAYAQKRDDDIDIHALYEWGFRYACSNGHLSVVEWLINFSEDQKARFKNKRYIEVHASDDYGLRMALNKGHIKVVKYLINIIKNNKDVYGYMYAHFEKYIFINACKYDTDIAASLLDLPYVPIDEDTIRLAFKSAPNEHRPWVKNLMRERYIYNNGSSFLSKCEDIHLALKWGFSTLFARKS